MKEQEIKKKIEELQTDEKIAEQIGKNKSKAEYLLKDKNKM